MSDNGLFIVVNAGPQWTFRPGDGGMDCPTLEKNLTGDGPVSWSYTFRQYTDRLPGRFAHVEVHDDSGLIQTGRLVVSTPPDTGSCDGPCQLQAHGYWEALSDRKFDHSVIFGPRWQYEVNAGNPTLARTADGAITYAVSQLGGTIGSIAAGPTIDKTEDFIGRPSTDVIRAMTALRGGLATPYVPRVRLGSFSWEPLDLAARYQVAIGDGVTYAPTDDASRLYNRVIVIYRGVNAVTYPLVPTYGQIPTIVDLVVNAGSEVNDRASAQALAESLYGKLQTLELGWSGTLTISGDAPISGPGGLTSGPRVDAATFIRMTGLDSASRYGRNIPDSQLIVNAKWDGPNDQLVCQLGEMRSASEVSRLVLETVNLGNSKPYQAYTFPGTNNPTPDADKYPTVPALATEGVAPGDGGPSAPAHTTPATQTAFGIPAVDTKQQTVDPSAVPPHPPEIAYETHSADLTGRKGISWVQPVRLTQYSISADQACTVTVVGKLVSTGATIITLKLQNQQTKQNQTITAADSPLVGTGTFADITTRDGIRWEITVADPTMAGTDTEDHFVSWGIGSVRVFPGYSSLAPVTGGKV